MLVFRPLIIYHLGMVSRFSRIVFVCYTIKIKIIEKIMFSFS